MLGITTWPPSRRHASFSNTAQLSAQIPYIKRFVNRYCSHVVLFLHVSIVNLFNSNSEPIRSPQARSLNCERANCCGQCLFAIYPPSLLTTSYATEHLLSLLVAFDKQVISIFVVVRVWHSRSDFFQVVFNECLWTKNHVLRTTTLALFRCVRQCRVYTFLKSITDAN